MADAGTPAEAEDFSRAFLENEVEFELVVMATDKTQSEVDQILSQADENKKSSFKSIEIFKEVEPNIDVGNLLLLDQQPLAITELRCSK